MSRQVKRVLLALSSTHGALLEAEGAEQWFLPQLLPKVLPLHPPTFPSYCPSTMMRILAPDDLVQEAQRAMATGSNGSEKGASLTQGNCH